MDLNLSFPVNDMNMWMKVTVMLTFVLTYVHGSALFADSVPLPEADHEVC
jgi:hypothetical protein